jgi:hypothetical protein
MKVEEYEMREEEVPEVWKIVDLTDDELVNTDAIIRNWIREIEQLRKEQKEVI